MAVAKRIFQCECGECFSDSNSGLEGKLSHSPWKYEAIRERTTKTKGGSDIVVLTFVRSVDCGTCGERVMSEKRYVELSATAKEHPATTTVNREINTVPGVSIKSNELRLVAGS